MKTFKNLFPLSMLILFSIFSYAQDSMYEPAIITLVSSKNIQDASEMIVDLKGEIMTDTWHKDTTIRIEVEIKANNVTRDVVKHLIRNGRFRLELKELDEGSKILSMPGLRKKITINGIPLSETMSFRILVPENVLVKIKAGQD